MPILIGPQLASAVPSGSTEGLGEYLLEGMSRQYQLFVPADWAELVPTEQLWLGATASRPGGAVDSERWPDTRSPGPTLAYGPNPTRNA